MIFWIDAQLPPQIASWIKNSFQIDAYAVRDLGLRDAPDKKIFQAAKVAGSVVMTKDKDFVDLLHRFGSPPQIIWLTLGNTSNQRLKQVLQQNFPNIQSLLERQEPLVEIRDTL